MKLLKTTIFSGIITFVKIASTFVASKVVAISAGPAGVAIVGAFTNFITISQTFANGAINNGVIKYSSEYNGDSIKLKTLISTSLRITIYSSIISGILLILFSGFISSIVFMNELYVNPIRLLGLTIVLTSCNTLILSVLNGLGEIKLYTFVNAIGSIISLIFTVTLVYFYNVIGALYALVFSQSIILLVSVILLRKKAVLRLFFNVQPIDKTIAANLSKFSFMAIISALTMPLVQIIIRNFLIAKVGIDESGYWQGMMRISDGYLMLITTSLSTYYLPKLSSLKTNGELKTEIYNGYKVIIPAVIVSCGLIFLLRFLIIKVLFTSDFISMEKLFIWQLLGDIFKICAWVLAYLMLAKAMTKLFVITEIIFGLSYIIITYFCVIKWGVLGASIAFAINYFLYLLAMVIIFRKKLSKNE
ncbi:O-antigen translocase [Pedobacter soli]|uniref:Polysaccharide transporter, PST family n=1 Tax=Pedobacter soli TaxID=390242 RepID=A0A1G6PEB7_9SPHI|nr:O-antigen translocase [Pedobacter soli]SDC77894.1 polysaccharide transporter, PST family [Pedobacter soli]